jgi:UDP-2,4-diacetamido-2,4,6-trideoxy-beta-L-altropyranose hydrolase
MDIYIRADSSELIGIGHIMRTLTLSDSLKALGFKIVYICTNAVGNINDLIVRRGYDVSIIENSCIKNNGKRSMPISDECILKDANETIDCIKEKCNWLIVDHYYIDYRWHSIVRKSTDRIMVIDDLANRKLDCDLLLDQTYGRKVIHYSSLVNHNCKLLLGSKYALIRPQFLSVRDGSIKRRLNNNIIRNILISVGGIDINNVSLALLNTIYKIYKGNGEIVINVVLTGKSPNIDLIKKFIENSSLNMTLFIDVEDMENLMAEADVSIGGGGTTSWERCVVALPSIVVVQADNQKFLSGQLEAKGAIIILKKIDDLPKVIQSIEKNSFLSRMSYLASLICDGFGSTRVSKSINYLC